MQQLSVILKKSVISVPLFLNDSSHLSLFSQTDTFIPNSYHLLRQNLIFALLKKKTKKNRAVFWCWSARLKHMNNHTARNVYVFWLSRINPREKRVSLLMKKPLLYPAGKQRKREKNKAEKMKEEDEILSGYMKPMMRTQIWGGVRLTHNYATTWQRQTEWYDLFILLIQALWCV